MSIKLYMDVHVPYAITVELKRRGVDVITSQEDGTSRFPDAKLLDRATALDRSLFTRDEDFLVEADIRHETGRKFAGVIYARQKSVTISQCIEDLELIAGAYDFKDMANRVEYLPLK